MAKASISEERYLEIAEVFREELAGVEFSKIPSRFKTIASRLKMSLPEVRKAWLDGYPDTEWGVPIREFLRGKMPPAPSKTATGTALAERTMSQERYRSMLATLEIEAKHHLKDTAKGLARETLGLVAIVGPLRDRIETDVSKRIGTMSAEEAMSWIAKISKTAEGVAKILFLTQGELPHVDGKEAVDPKESQMYQDMLQREIARGVQAELKRLGVNAPTDVIDAEFESTVPSSGEVAEWRVVIAGIPRAGKTTMAKQLGETTMKGALLRHTDDVKDLGWSEASDLVVQWFDTPGPWIIEGVAAVRALRKWLAAHPDGAPCDEIVWLDQPHVALSKGQQTMAKGCVTIWSEIRSELERRGVSIGTA